MEFAQLSYQVFEEVVSTYHVIDNVDAENNTLTVLIDLFGQETPVEVEMSQVNVD